MQHISKRASKTTSTRFRPLGLLLAILATGVIYGIGPLMSPLMILIINLRGGRTPLEISGVSTLNMSEWLNAAIGLIVIAVCIMAWRGRPAWSRWVLIAIVWFATLMQVATLLFPPTQNSIEGSNLSDLTRPVMFCQFALYILVPLYITWYMNRAPARAFYQQGS